MVGLFENEVYPSVAKTLSALKKEGYRLFVATAKPTIYAKRILDHFELSQYFVHIYGSELTGERTNKADLIHYILEHEQLNPEECLMVGDRQYDILGARHNGIEAVAVTYGYGIAEELAQAQPKAMIKQFSELLDYVEELATQKKVS